MKRQDGGLRPGQIFRAPQGDTIACRCEEVTAERIRSTVALGATGPTQMKAFLRCGMGVPRAVMRADGGRADCRRTRSFARRGRQLSAAPSGEADYARRVGRDGKDRGPREGRRPVMTGTCACHDGKTLPAHVDIARTYNELGTVASQNSPARRICLLSGHHA